MRQSIHDYYSAGGALVRKKGLGDSGGWFVAGYEDEAAIGHMVRASVSIEGPLG